MNKGCFFSSCHERATSAKLSFFAQYLLLRRLQHRLWVVPHLHQKFFLTLTPVARKKEAVLLDFAWIGLRIFLCISDHIMLTKHKCYRRHQYFKGVGEKLYQSKRCTYMTSNIPDLTPILTKNK